MKLIATTLLTFSVFATAADFPAHEPETCPNLAGSYWADATTGGSEISVRQEKRADGHTKYFFSGNGMTIPLLANGAIHYWDDREGGTGDLNLCNGGEFHAFWINKGKVQSHSIYFFDADGALFHRSIDNYGDKTYSWRRL